METPLNLAHRHQRQAEILLKLGKFDEAVQHHISAEKALSEIVITTNSPHILLSLKLQREYHIRQQAVVKRKKQLAEAFKEYQDKLKENRSKAIDSILLTPKYDSQSTTSLIQHVLKTALVHDSLINSMILPELLSRKKEPLSQSVDSILKSVVKVPKDDKVRLEELRISNEELKRVLIILVTDLEKAHVENINLKTLLEESLKNRTNPPIAHADIHQPSVAQCHSLMSPPLGTELKSSDSVCDLPALAPVKIPNLHLNKELETKTKNDKDLIFLSDN